MRKAVLPALVAVLVLLGGAATWLAVVDVDLPEPTGPHAVGRMAGEFGEQRRVAYTVYHPALAGSGEPGAYMPAAIAQEVAERDLGAFRHLPDAWSRIHGAARDGAEWSPGRFPLVVFSPGADVQPQYYSSLLAELASHGFVVAALSHPGLTPAIAYADGSVAFASDPPWPRDAAEAERQTEGRIASVAADILAAVEALRADARLASHLDGQVGAFGHSLGGAGAASAAAASETVQAVGDMDGSLGQAARGIALARPVFFMADDGDVMPADQEARDGFVRGGQPGLKVTLHGASHMTFATDVNFFEELRPFGDSDQLGAREAHGDIAKPLVEFFTAALP